MKNVQKAKFDGDFALLKSQTITIAIPMIGILIATVGIMIPMVGLGIDMVDIVLARVG